VYVGFGEKFMFFKAGGCCMIAELPFIAFGLRTKYRVYPLS